MSHLSPEKVYPAADPRSSWQGDMTCVDMVERRPRKALWLFFSPPDSTLATDNCSARSKPQDLLHAPRIPALPGLAMLDLTHAKIDLP